MGRVWKASEKAILARLDRYIERLAEAQAAGLEISPNWAFQIDRYVELLGTIGQELNRYGLEAADITERQQRTAGELGVNHAQELMRASEIGTSFVRVPVDAVANIVGALNDGSPLRELFNSLGPNAIDTAEQTFTALMAAGKGPREMARAFKKELGITRRRAELITRTESLRAYRESQRTNYKANASVISGWRWVAARDSRTCPICLAMDGSEHELDEQMATHPGCRCTQSPIPKYRRVTRQTGEDFLREKPESEQKRILGPSRYRLWKGGMPLRSMVETVPNSKWGPSTRLIPLVRLGNASASTPPRPTPTPTPAAPSLPTIVSTSASYRNAAQKSVQIIRGTSLSTKRAISAGRDIINKIHGPGELENLNQYIKLARYNGEVKSGKLPAFEIGPFGPSGYFSRVEIVPGLPITGIGSIATDYAAVGIGMARGSGPDVFIHEFGHFIDAFASPLTSGHMMSEVGEPIITRVVDEMRRSAAMTSAVRSSWSPENWDYLHKPAEIWARAYFQYITEASQDPGLRQALDTMRQQAFTEHWQPSDADFASVYPLVEDVLRNLGMIK
jgi:SPP1 gp7 family putative phage head morphogenesis protein